MPCVIYFITVSLFAISHHNQCTHFSSDINHKYIDFNDTIYLLCSLRVVLNKQVFKLLRFETFIFLYNFSSEDFHFTLDNTMFNVTNTSRYWACVLKNYSTFPLPIIQTLLVRMTIYIFLFFYLISINDEWGCGNQGKTCNFWQRYTLK